MQFCNYKKSSNVKRILLILSFFICFAINTIASIPYFKALEVDRENNNVHINILFQDHEGYVWTGTDHGLYRYDGFLFSHIDVAVNDSIENITAIVEDANNSMLIGMQNGGIMRFEKNKFISIKSPFTSPVRKMIQGKDGVLWVATYGEGIFYLNNLGWHRIAGLPDPFIYTIVTHPSGVILAGTDLGFVVIDPREKQLHYKVYDTRNGLPDNLVREIYCEKNGDIWLGMQEKGICKFNLETKQFSIPENLLNWNYGSITCMARLDNEFWIGTSGNGIIDFEFQGDKRVRTFSKKEGFSYSNINDMIRGREGSIWVASENKLLMSTGEKFEIIPSDNTILFDSIHAITTDRNGYIWISNNQGLFKYDYTVNGQIKKYLTEAKYKNLHIVSIYEDESGYIWLGTFDNGLFRLEPNSGNVKRYSIDQGLRNANVIAINGSEDKIWLATLGGVTLCEKPNDLLEEAKGNYKFINYSDNEGPGSIFVYCVYIDKRGRVWFGTDGKGITVYENGKFTSYHDFDKSRGKVVYSITEDHEGNIWFSTLNHGVYRFDGKNFRNFGLSSGLKDLNISGLTTDRAGNIIIVHQRGIDILHPQTFEWEYLGKEVGIESLDCDLNAISRDFKNNIWIGSQHGLIRFVNNSITTDHQPETHIQKTYTFMKPGAGLNDSIFKYNQNQISFEYIGLWYSNPEAVSYRFRLIGLSNKWINTHDRIVTYPNLPPGNYRFEVMSSFNNQFLHPKIDHFNFRIRKPIYKETWFILALTLVGSIGLFWFLRDRELRFRRIESLKKEKIEYQFATLKSQVNPHFLFNSFNTLISIIEEDSTKAVTYVENLSDYFRNMIQHRDKDTVLLSEELEMVKTYFFLQQKRFGNNLSLEFNIPNSWKSKYQLPPLSLQLLIENAVKHNAVSYETKLKITVSATDRESLLIVNNLNPKLFPDKSTGIGLENIISRFRILTPNDVKILRTETEFKVEIPLILLS